MVKRKEKVTIRDIAKAAEVSPALVSFVMSNKNKGTKIYRVKDETARHILEVAEMLNYKPNYFARALKSGRTNAVGLIVSDISNAFFADIARDLEDYAYHNDCTVLFGSTDEDPDRFNKVVGAFLDKGVDGLIVVPCQHSEGLIREVSLSGVPIVLLDRSIEGTAIPSVTLNNKKASYEMTDRLISKGFRLIDMISYDMEITNIRDRELGFIDAMVDSGLGSNFKIHRLSHHEDRKEVDTIVQDSRSRGVEAFLFATNTLALRGMSALSRGGFHIPQDFGIACFDYNCAFDICDSDIIYAKQPIDRFATEAMKCILRFINDGEAQSVVLESEIIDAS